MKKTEMDDKQTKLDCVDFLASLLEQAKQKEREAREHRLSIEERLIDVIGREVEGSRSQRSDKYRVRTVSTLKRKVDQERVHDLINLIGSDVFADVFRVKYEINKAEFIRLRDASPNKFMMVSNIITTTPTKTAVEVEKLH
ncbi:DUF7173 family protein [Spartinivicinus ruber]|uniref:DUF7173 family protein n=1 Tax=Spartinivicinus ruber TaxID=2683272 RepID=UPI0013CFB4DC|nr:hypothetical protein [Spartinivicinus ruber]